MFDVNLNNIEREALCNLLDVVQNGLPASYERVYQLVDNLLDIRYNRGKRQGAAMFRDAVIDSIVSELKR